MERSLEPELMEATTHANAYAGADFSNSDISFINRLATLAREYGLSSTSYAMLVDLGCGPGKITEELARHWPHWDILGIDGSAAMLDIALRRRDNSKSLRNLHYCQLNLTTLKDQVSNFYRQVKIIVSNSLLHHLHTPSTLWGVVEHLAAPGVNLTLHRDLRRPPNSEAASDLVQRYAGSSSAILYVRIVSATINYGQCWSRFGCQSWSAVTPTLTSSKTGLVCYLLVSSSALPSPGFC